MSKRVLSVGQCGPDSAALARFLHEHFDVEIEEAALSAEAFALLKSVSFDLVLINRKLDADYSDGLEIVRALTSDAEWSDLPVMLVSNYSDAQAAAVAIGAKYGFGKLEYDSPETVERLAKILT